MKQKLGPHQADPVDISGVESAKFGEAGDIDHDSNQFTRRRARRTGEFVSYLASFRLLGTTLIKTGSHIGVGIDNQKPRIRVEQRVGAIFEMIDVYAHNHGYAARPRQNGDVAARASPPQYQPAILPIGGQEGRRRHIVSREDNAWRHDLIRFTGQMSQNAIPQIAQIR
ncbi:MAG TPA: hypothetical protein VK621_02935, partial [Bradyrhizobium sp.]|nr:hypothetical protein [Bradyrhizobium sp.]